MWILQLNDMRERKSENLTFIASADTREQLDKFLLEESVPPYKDEGENYYGPTTFNKVFRKGGPLEWYNQPYHTESMSDLGTLEERVRAVTAQVTEQWSYILSKRIQ